MSIFFIWSMAFMTRFDFAGSGSLSIQPGGQCSRQVTDPPDIGAPSSRLSKGSLTTVLLLEDEPALRHLLSRALLVAGFRVLEGGDGREGLLLAQANPGAVGMVVTDIDMPLMDGGEEQASAGRRERLPDHWALPGGVRGRRTRRGGESAPAPAQVVGVWTSARATSPGGNGLAVAV
jgi:hypothetical protein